MPNTWDHKYREMEPKAKLIWQFHKHVPRSLEYKSWIQVELSRISQLNKDMNKMHGIDSNSSYPQ